MALCPEVSSSRCCIYGRVTPSRGACLGRAVGHVNYIVGLPAFCRDSWRWDGAETIDLGTYILDSILRRSTAAGVNPKELLWGIFLSLSKMHGTRPCLLPILLGRSKDFLAIESPVANPTIPATEDDHHMYEDLQHSGLGNLPDFDGRRLEYLL